MNDEEQEAQFYLDNQQASRHEKDRDTKEAQKVTITFRVIDINIHKKNKMVVMDSVTAAAAAAAAAAASEAAAADVHRAWYESAALGPGHAAASATATDDLTDAYFKGQNAAYISQMSYHHGMGQGECGRSKSLDEI